MRKYLFVIYSSLLILSACGFSNESEETNAGETEEEVNNENAENNEDSNEINRDNVNSGVMKLGDTGLVDDELGQYEITPTSVEIFTERDGIIPNNDDEVFVLIDYTVEFLSDEAFEEEDILGIRLLLKNTQGNEVTEISYYDYEFVDRITGTIEPGESYDSQMLFEIPESESSEYTLHFGSYSADVEDAEWFFTEDEAK
ncbi:DUF4352 domain-containing protein [Pseudogracilibacillus sp. SO30301A]|uniref:DUF4352 domain-containing protein n=1 Tax=Pseudogracilibacillus sp. SO30301A TaxID=3098291 RepID=UPI00300DE6BD